MWSFYFGEREGEEEMERGYGEGGMGNGVFGKG